MGIDVKLGYYRGKLSSYESVKHLYLAQQSGIGITNGYDNLQIGIYNWGETPDVYYISESWGIHNRPKTFEEFQKESYLAFYPTFVELHNATSAYGSWWIESLTGLKSRACNWDKIIPRYFERHELGKKLPVRRYVRYDTSLDDNRHVWSNDKEVFDFPLYKNQKIKFDYNMMPISELPKFPKYKINRKKMNLLRKANADFPQYVEAMYKLLPKPIPSDWLEKAEEDKNNKDLDKKYRNFLELVWRESRTYRSYTYTGHEVKLERLLENIDAHLKRMHPEVLDQVQ